MVEGVILVFALALVVQFLVDVVKKIVGDKVMAYVPAPIWSAVFGILIAFVANIDVFVMFGITTTVPIVTVILSGLIISAGSAPLHELYEKIRELRQGISTTLGGDPKNEDGGDVA